MVHIEFRGPNDLPYVYESYRDESGEVHNRYIGRLNEYMAEHRGQGIGVVLDASITKYTANPAEISVSLRDISDKYKYQSLRADVDEVRGFHRNKDKAGRNENIEYAKLLKQDGLNYRQIAERLGIGRSTAFDWVNSTKPKPDYFIDNR